jgi:hypothetical protein
MWLTKQQIDYASVAMKLSSLLGRTWNVKVLFGGHPSTDGQTIVLPHWNFEDPALRTALYGLIAHEAGGHVRQTDFGILEAVSQKRKNKPGFTVWKSCENILEDIRIEASLLRQYPGAVIYLNAAVEYMLGGELKEADTGTYWQLALNWCLCVFRHECLGQDFLAPKAKFLDDAFQKVVQPDVLLAARNIAHAVADLGSDKGKFIQVIDHADDLFALLDAARPSNQPRTPPQAQSGQNGGDPTQGGEKGQNGSHACDDNQGDPNGSDGTQGDQSAQNGGDGTQSSQTGSDGTQSNQPLPNGSDGRARPTGNAILSEAVPAAALGDVFADLSERGALPGKAQKDIPVLGVGNDAVDSAGLNEPPLLFRQAFQAASAMRQSLTAAVAPMLCGDMEYSANATRGSRLNSQRIARALAEQEPAVFRKVLIDDDQSVAVQILLDRSSSTAGPCLFQEMISAIGLVSCLEQFPDVETAISYFPPNIHGEPHLTGAPFLKMFGEPLGKTLNRWPKSNGGTPLAEAYTAAALNFLLTAKERRLLFCVTDGQPYDVDAVREQKEFLRSLGVAVYGIVVSADPYPGGLFDDSIQIPDASQLPHSLASLVRRIL